jgi:glycosyltransferase 2 family protein
VRVAETPFKAAIMGLVKRGSPAVRAALATAVVVAAAVLLVRVFAGIDARATARAIGRAGPFAPLVLAPFLIAMTLDAAGIQILLRALGRPVSLAHLLPIRVATEALHLTAPAGFVVADSATAKLLDSRCGVPVGEGTVLVVARKWLVMRAHAAYIAVGAACGAALLVRVSERVLGSGWLPWAVGGSALIPLGLSLGLGAAFHGRPALDRLRRALGRVPWRCLRDRAARWRSNAIDVDRHLARVGAARSATWLASAAFFACWLVESAETALIVKLVGGRFDLAFAMAVEVGISLLRSVGNVAPAGLGVQDAGYAVLFQSMGLPSHTAAAFVLLKRGKELAWIALGYGLLAMLRRPLAVPDSALLGGRVARPAALWAIIGQSRRAASRQPAV